MLPQLKPAAARGPDFYRALKVKLLETERTGGWVGRWEGKSLLNGDGLRFGIPKTFCRWMVFAGKRECA